MKDEKYLMKTNFNKKYVLITGLIISAVFFAYSAEAASFNYGPQDSPTFQASNYSRNPGCNTCWSGSVSANAGEIISFMVYYHNTENDAANNTTLQVSLPGGTFSSATASGNVSASNASGASGSVGIYLSSNQSLTFIPGSLKWYPNQSSNPQNAPFSQNGSEIIQSGLNIGNIAGGWPGQGYAVFQAQVSSNYDSVAAPTPSYTSSYYTPSYVPVYVPAYNPSPTPTYTAPTPTLVAQPRLAVAAPVARSPIFQRSEENLEFEIYLDKESALVGNEDILFARYYNAGGSIAKNATLHIYLPDGVEFLKFTATPAVMREDNIFEYNIGPVNPGEEKIVSLNFLVGDRVVPGNNLNFEGKLVYAGSKGGAKSIQDSAALEITTSNQLTASAYSVLGPIFNSWFRQLIIGILIGLLIYHYLFTEKKKDSLKFK